MKPLVAVAGVELVGSERDGLGEEGPEVARDQRHHREQRHDVGRPGIPPVGWGPPRRVRAGAALPQPALEQGDEERSPHGDGEVELEDFGHRGRVGVLIDADRASVGVERTVVRLEHPVARRPLRGDVVPGLHQLGQLVDVVLQDQAAHRLHTGPMDGPERGSIVVRRGPLEGSVTIGGPRTPP